MVCDRRRFDSVGWSDMIYVLLVYERTTSILNLILSAGNNRPPGKKSAFTDSPLLSRNKCNLGTRESDLPSVVSGQMPSVPEALNIMHLLFEAWYACLSAHKSSPIPTQTISKFDIHFRAFLHIETYPKKSWH